MNSQTGTTDPREAALQQKLGARIEAHLAGQSDRDLGASASGKAKVERVRLLAGGACQENFVVDFSTGGGPTPATMVLRSDAKSSLPESLDRAAEFAVIGAVCDAGVKTPRARWL